MSRRSSFLGFVIFLSCTGYIVIWSISNIDRGVAYLIVMFFPLFLGWYAARLLEEWGYRHKKIKECSVKQTIFLRSKQQQQAAINAILATPLDKDKPVTIRITDYKRNLDQNAKFHTMLADIARQVQWCGKWLKPEQWKVLLISGHAVATKQEADVLPGLEGEYVNIRESSAQMSVKRMASLIEYTTAWAIGQGVRFTDRRYE